LAVPNGKRTKQLERRKEKMLSMKFNDRQRRRRTEWQKNVMQKQTCEGREELQNRQRTVGSD
jgi:hypothetical protein